jgi:hypothetical protein
MNSVLINCFKFKDELGIHFQYEQLALVTNCFISNFRNYYPKAKYVGIEKLAGLKTSSHHSVLFKLMCKILSQINDFSTVILKTENENLNSKVNI